MLASNNGTTKQEQNAATLVAGTNVESLYLEGKHVMIGKPDGDTEGTNYTVARGPQGRVHTRREALGLLGAAGISLIAGAKAADALGNNHKEPTPEGEIGPFFVDDSAAGFHRKTIVTNIDGTGKQVGVPLTLKIYVYDSEAAFAPVKGAQVDIWHCNAYGVYSGEDVLNTQGETWLRGYQITDATGLAAFHTIIPGWYPGRTAHIHMRVRSKYSDTGSLRDGTNTTQLFFPQAVIDSLYTTVAPYNERGKETTTNARDNVYMPQTAGETQVILAGSMAHGYTSTFAINLPITQEY